MLRKENERRRPRLPTKKPQLKTSDMNEPKISVIIPVRNEVNKIEQCLEAVFAQSLKPYEVIVVDAHSTDGTIGKARKFPVKTLYEDYHTRGGACQVGIEHAEGEFIAFTDADCIPDKNWLANLVKEFKDGVVGVGGGVKNIGKGLWVRSFNLALGTFLGSARSVQGRFFRDKQFVRSISGANSMYRRQDILDVGGFNLSPIGEDRDLNNRLARVGKLLYTPDAVILHDHRRGLGRIAKVMYRYGRQRAAMKITDLQIIPPLIAPLLLLSLIFIPFIFTPWLSLGIVFLYLAAVMAMGIKFAAQEKDVRFLFSIPAVYILEHASYIAGFWRELTWPYKRLHRERLKR